MSPSVEFLRGAKWQWATGSKLCDLDALLAQAEAREASPDAAAISADRAWIDGASFGWNCESKKELCAAIENRKRQIREEKRIPREPDVRRGPDAAAVSAQCKEAIERSVTLLDATHRFVESNDLGEYGVFVDEADCDGACLADDCQCAEQAGQRALAAVAEWEAGRG